MDERMNYEDSDLFDVPTDAEILANFKALVAAGRAVTADGTPVPAETNLFDLPDDDSISIWFGPGPAPAGWTPAPPGCHLANFEEYFPD